MARKPKQPDSCGTCKYSRPVEGSETIICQRYPPKVLSVIGDRIMSNWPLLSKTEWCGEYATAQGGKH